MAVLKFALVCALLCAVVVSGAEADAERKPRRERKLITPKVIATPPLMPKHRVIVVPKGDPRARPPTGSEALSVPSSSPVLKNTAPVANSAQCAAKGGKCATGACAGTVFRGVCPGVSTCCIPSASTPAAPAPAVDVGDCGVYSTFARSSKKGNGGVVYEVVPIATEHMSDPSDAGLPDDKADNTMRLQPTACAFSRMQAAAAKDGVFIKIASGFRSLARQQYFWNCFQTKKCNSGNRAAVPGSSNHGQGIALDLNTDCGKQFGAKPPAACKSSAVYMWLLKNARTHGFIRAVPSEPWHWEYHAGVAPPAYQLF